jgi:hypothetical protein
VALSCKRELMKLYVDVFEWKWAVLCLQHCFWWLCFDGSCLGELKRGVRVTSRDGYSPGLFVISEGACENFYEITGCIQPFRGCYRIFCCSQFLFMTHSDQQTYWPPPTCTPSHSHYLLEKIIMTRRMDIHSFLHATTLLTELLLVVWI